MNLSIERTYSEPSLVLSHQMQENFDNFLLESQQVLQLPNLSTSDKISVLVRLKEMKRQLESLISEAL